MILTVINCLICYLYVGLLFNLYMYNKWKKDVLSNIISWTWKDDILYITIWPMILLSILLFGIYKLFTISKSLFKKMNKK